MKNIIFINCIILLITSCSKKGNNINSSNTWNFAGKSYTAAIVMYINAGSEANLSASTTGERSSSANGLSFTFLTPPTANTQMLITSTNDANTVLVTASNFTGTSSTYYSNDVTTTKANITVNNGKVGISFPGTIWLHNDSNYSDSAQLSVGTITQQ